MINQSVGDTNDKSNVAIAGEYIIVDGERKPIPLHVLKRKRHTSALIDGKIYVNGYEYKKGKWKRTLMAILYDLF